MMTIVLAVGVVGAAWRLLPASGGLPSDAVFRYEGKVVTVADMNSRLVVLNALYGVKRPAGNDSQFYRAVAKSMAVSAITERAAALKGIVITDNAANSALNTLIQQQLSGGMAGFNAFLTANRITKAEVLGEVKDQLAASQLMNLVTKNVAQPTATQVSAAYAQNRAQIKTPETRHLLNIVVSTIAAAREVARLARAQSFADLARRYSEDGSTRLKGGDLGVVAQDELDKSYGAAAFSAKLGQVFGPVQTQFGWNVGRVAAITPPRFLSFNQVRGEISAELLSEAKLKVWAAYLKQLLTRARVQYATRFRPADPFAIPSDLLTPPAR